MFGDVWKWAGNFRLTEKNIGKVAAYQVQEEIHKLCANTKFQIKHDVENWELTAIIFHHRLVSIHPFPNGNGRHARLCTDLLLRYNDQKPLPWGKSDLLDEKDYINALCAADKGDLQPLLEFATKRI